VHSVCCEPDPGAFAAISTVVNNPRKKSAPPKAHAAVPPAPRVELPRVRRKDFNSYLSAIEPEWGAFQRNTEFGRAGSAQLEESSTTVAFNETDSQRTPLPPKSLPPLSSVPEIFFKPPFDLGDPRTFDAVAEVPSTSTSSSSHPSPSRPTSPMTPHDPSALAHTLPLLEKLSHHADTIEQHLVHEIAYRATPFFAALSNLQDLQEESARCLKRVQGLRAQLGHVSEHGARRGLRGVQREIRLAHLREVQSVVRAVSGVIETVGIVRGLVDDGHWGEALDGVDDLQAMWDGPSAPGPASLLVPSLQASELPSVAEEEPLDDEEEEVESGEEMSLSVGAELEIPLSRLKAFAALPSQLQTLTQEITSSLTSDLVATLKIDLLERINRADSSSSDQTDVRDRLRPLIQGLVRTKNLKEGIAEWRGVVLGEVQGLVQQVFLLPLDLAWAEGVSHHSIYPRLTLERTHRRNQALRGQLSESTMCVIVHCYLQLDKFVALHDTPRVPGVASFHPAELFELHRGSSDTGRQHHPSHQGYPVRCQDIRCNWLLIRPRLDHHHYR